MCMYVYAQAHTRRHPHAQTRARRAALIYITRDKECPHMYAYIDHLHYH